MFQGFHVLFDGHDGFAGLSCGCLQHINDEYTSKAVLSFISMPSYFPSTTILEESRRVVNLALAVSSLPELSSLFCPISTVKEGWRSPKEIRGYPFLNYNVSLIIMYLILLKMSLAT